MGWLEGEEWESAPNLSLADEAKLLTELAQTSLEIVGVDLAGLDVRCNEQIARYRFEQSCTNLSDVKIAMEVVLPSLK